MAKYPRKHRKKAVGKVSKAVKKYVKKAVHKLPELKYTNVQENGLSISNATFGALSSYYCCTDAIQQGTSDTNNRVGDQITLYDIDSRVVLENSLSAAANNDYVFVRLIMFQWHDMVDTTGAVGSGLSAILPLTELFQLGSGGVIAFNSAIDVDNRRAKRLSILYDKMMPVLRSVTASAYTENSVRMLHIYKRLKNRKLFYEAGSQTKARGHIFIIALSNWAYDVTHNVNVYSTHLTRFSDA